MSTQHRKGQPRTHRYGYNGSGVSRQFSSAGDLHNRDIQERCEPVVAGAVETLLSLLLESRLGTKSMLF